MWDNHLGRVSVEKQLHQTINRFQICLTCTIQCGTHPTKFSKNRDWENVCSGSYPANSNQIGRTQSLFQLNTNEFLYFCVSVLRLNSHTGRDLHSTQRMDESIDSNGEAAFISVLSAHSGYWEVEIEDEDLVITTWSTLHDYNGSCVCHLV